MIGVWSSYSPHYLCIIATGILITFALPLLLVPMKFARVLRWQIPDHEHLAIYYGRCLGGVATGLGVFAFKVAGSPALQPFYFQLVLCIFSILTLVHAYGAIRRIQPITETLEVGFWFALIVLTMCFYPG